MKAPWGKPIQSVGTMNTSNRKPKTSFYDPAVATKEIVDEVYASVNDRNKLN